MIKIISRNMDGSRALHQFVSPRKLVDDWSAVDCSMGDNEILLVVWDEYVVYSSLGRKVGSYEDTVRARDIIDWFCTELDDDMLMSKKKPRRIETPLPDGTTLVAEIWDDVDYPGIRTYLKKQDGTDECVCFTEYNTVKPEGMQLCICAYARDIDEPVYYESYNAPASASPNI